jgi:hypothetical protein
LQSMARCTRFSDVTVRSSPTICTRSMTWGEKVLHASQSS